MSEASPESELRDWLRHLKAESGASYAAIAQAIEEEERTVKRWMPERADAKVVVPRGDALLRLLDFFGVTLTPPAPRAVALSLLGEIRELRASIEQARHEELLPKIAALDRRLEALAEQADRAAALTAEGLEHLAAAIGQLAERLPPREQRGQKAAR